MTTSQEAKSDQQAHGIQNDTRPKTSDFGTQIRKTEYIYFYNCFEIVCEPLTFKKSRLVGDVADIAAIVREPRFF